MKGGGALSNTEDKLKTAKKLKKLMKKKGVTCYKIANDLEVSETSVHAWVNGEYIPKLKNTKKLADYFGVPITYFIE